VNSFSRICLGAALTVLAAAAHAGSTGFELQKGDHVAFIGNALADRMQHHGWLESYLQYANPDKQLVIRNMGFSGDEVAHRPRNENFMTADAYLKHVEADVIFAFFGYNESYDQDPEEFKKELREFIDHTRAQKYDGKSKPRIVLFSPIAFEDLQTHNLPDGIERNLWQSIYTDAMARVANEKNVPFVDLYAATQKLYEETNENLTINGIHPNSAGNRAIAKVIVEALGGDTDAPEDRLAAIREAVLDKNWCWFNRYRATNGNDIWGTRAGLKFVDQQTNKEVLQHELVMLDVMTKNRDRVIWAANKGRPIEPDDSNVPDPVLVKTNYEPSEKTGTLEYVPPEKGVDTLTLADGFEANLFASEEMFPELVNPVQLDVDTRGRLWVAAWKTYPKWQPDRPMDDRLLIMPDEDRDGVADEAITFAYVHNPTGFTFWNGGVVVASAPNLWFIKDTDGDDVGDHWELLLTGLDSADTHHSANGFDYGPDGYIYYQRGIFNVSNIETPWQSAQLSGRSAMYRFDPRTHRFSFHADNPPNPHGGDFDYWGYHYANDATGGHAFQVRMDGKGGFEMHELLKKTVRPVASSGIISSTHFPEENQGNYIILNTIGFLGIKQYELENTDGEVWGTETDDLLVSSDGNFRPTDFKFGDDGAMYVADWQNTLIGHMQHNVRDPSRDHEHGRIYRVTAKGRPLEESVRIDGEPIENLLDVLKHPANGVRLRARIELSERDTDDVILATQKWVQQFDPKSKEDAHHLLEALWLHDQHNIVNEELLNTLLESPEPHARRAAERVKYLWEIEGQLNADETTVMAADDDEEESVSPAHGAYRANCMSCHLPEKKLVGPPITEIYDIYKENPEGIVEFAKAPEKKRDDYQPMPPMAYVGDDKLKQIADYFLAIGSGDSTADAVDVHEWTVDELKSELKWIGHNRSFDRGKEVFTAASCAACHLGGDKGSGIAPDLADVKDRLDPLELMVEIIEPSKVVKEEYRPWTIELNDFTEVYGIIVEETDEYVRVVQDARTDKEGIKIPREKIDDMTQSELSPMPSALLNTFSRDDILDLMAYLRSGAKLGE